MKSQLFKLSQAVDFFFFFLDEGCVGKKGFAIQFSSINYSVWLRAAVREFACSEESQIVKKES